MTIKRKIMICCDTEKKNALEIRAKRVYGDYAEIVNKISEEPERLFVIGEITPEMRRIMAEARLYHVYMIRVDEQFRPYGLKDRMTTED